jgi:hypothetical protein
MGFRPEGVGHAVRVRSNLHYWVTKARNSGRTADYAAASVRLGPDGARGLLGLALRDEPTATLVRAARYTLDRTQTPLVVCARNDDLGGVVSLMRERTSPDELVAMRAVFRPERITTGPLVGSLALFDLAFPTIPYLELPVTGEGLDIAPDIDGIRQIPDELRSSYAQLAARIE